MMTVMVIIESNNNKDNLSSYNENTEDNSSILNRNMIRIVIIILSINNENIKPDVNNGSLINTNII